MEADRHQLVGRRAFLETLATAAAAAFGTRVEVAAQDAVDAGTRVGRALAGHRIRQWESRELQDTFPRAVGPMARGGHGGTGGAFRVVQLTTDQGASGWAMSTASAAQLDRFIGVQIGDLFDPTNGPVDDVRPFTMVMWDLVGNIAGLPVSRLLGSKGPPQVPLYSAAIYMEDLVPTDRPRGVRAVLDACRQDHRAGYRAFKLKVGRGRLLMPVDEGLARDVAVTRAVREAFPDCRILVDANASYTVEQAIAYVKGVADCDLYWFEEPFPGQRENLLRLRDAMASAGCSALIADGESSEGAPPPAPTAWGAYPTEFIDRLMSLAEERLVDVFVMDLGTVGFTQWTRLLPQLDAAGIMASPHLWMWTPRSYYCAHLAAGVGNIPIVEGIPGKATSTNYSAFKLRNGVLTIPDAPGFGLRLER